VVSRITAKVHLLAAREDIYALISGRFYSAIFVQNHNDFATCPLFNAPQRRTPPKFLNYLMRGKTRMMELPEGPKSFTIGLATYTRSKSGD